MNDLQAEYCAKCGQKLNIAGTSSALNPAATGTAFPGSTSDPALPGAAGPIQPVQPASGLSPLYATPVAVPAGFREYAGFWIRLLATLIDSAVLSVVMLPIVIVAFVALGVAGAATSAAARAGEAAPNIAANAAVVTFALLMFPVFVGIPWLYEATMTSSSKQATLGKMALGLRVITKEGNRLSFLHATGRHFAKMINNFTFYVGWIMAGFTERKQGLHDIIAGTYVVKP
jgi:uncharacterized RDD family membrane protein YckC